jgi:TRAP-type C4-dicarboxylate transport system permease small subunit
VENRSVDHCGWWDRFESGPILVLASVLFAASTLIMLSEGLNRSLRDVSFFWAEESVRYLMVWSFFLTLGLAGGRGYHIRTELLVDHVPPPMRLAMHLVASGAGLLFGIALFAASLPQLMRYYTLGMMSESDLDIPQLVVFLAMPIGSVLLSFYYAQCLIAVMHRQDPFALHGPTGSEL